MDLREQSVTKLEGTEDEQNVNVTGQSTPIAVGQECLEAEMERKPSGRLFTDLANSSHGGVGAASLANNLSKTYRSTNFAKVQSN